MMTTSLSAVAQPQKEAKLAPAASAGQPSQAADIARLVRAKVPWTWLLEDPDTGAAALTNDQMAQAEMMRSLAGVARHQGYDLDPRYLRLRNAMDEAALAEIARLSVEKAIMITDADRQSYLAAHPGRYDQFRLRHIYVAIHGTRDGSDRSEAQALELARNIEGRLAHGEAFETMATTHSDDRATAALGGELSVLTGAYMAAPFFTAVADAREGTITAPIRGDDGFHIIRIDQRIAANASTAAYQIEQDILKERLPIAIRRAIADTSGSVHES